MEVADLYATLGLKVQVSEWAEGDRRVKGLEKSAEAVEGAAKKAEGAFKLLSAAAIAMVGTEIVEFLGGMVEKTTSAAVENSHLAERLGITTEAVQQLSYAADLSGASAETLQAGLQRLTRSLAEFKTKGTGEIGTALGKLGIHMDDVAIKSGNLDEKLMRIADGFADSKHPADNLALSMEIFGRTAGPRLLPMLLKGGDGIAELRKEFVSLGAQIDGETTEQFKALEEDQKRLQYTMTGLRNQAVIALVPALRELAEATFEWFKENRVEIIEVIRKAVSALVTAFQLLGRVLGVVVQVGEAVYSALEPLVEWIADMIDKNQQLRDVLETVAIIAGVVAVALLAPWVFIAAAIAAVILVVQDLYSWFSGGPSIIGDAMAAIYAAIGRVTTRIDNWFSNEAPGAIQIWYASLKGLTEFAIGQFQVMLEYLDKIEDVISFVSKVPGLSLAGDFANGNLRGEASAAADTVRTGAANAGISAGFVGPGFQGAGSSGDGLDLRRFLGQAAAPGGGGDSSSASFQATITVHAGDGADGDAIGKSVTQQIREHWDSKMRELRATQPRA